MDEMLCECTKYIGITGITTKEDVSVITEELDNHLGMYGILMNRQTVQGRPRHGRWAGLEDIPDLMKGMPNYALKTIHWCDNSLDEKKVLKAIEATEGNCNAIQLNLVYPSPNFFKMLKENYNLETIFQIESCMFEKPKVMKKKILPYVGVVDYVLIDQSMGAGKAIDVRVSRAVANELKDLEFGIVFAGGLDAAKVVEAAALIEEFRASIDAEGRLMKDKSDGLDLIKVRDYIRAAFPIMKGDI